MKKLTRKEKEIMDLYWQHGPMFVKELLEYYDEPRPHFNTLSTTVRILEKKGMLGHKQFGTFTTSTGTELNYYTIKPTDFNANKRDAAVSLIIDESTGTVKRAEVTRRQWNDKTYRYEPVKENILDLQTLIEKFAPREVITL